MKIKSIITVCAAMILASPMANADIVNPGVQQSAYPSTWVSLDYNVSNLEQFIALSDSLLMNDTSCDEKSPTCSIIKLKATPFSTLGHLNLKFTNWNQQTQVFCFADFHVPFNNENQQLLTTITTYDADWRPLHEGEVCPATRLVLHIAQLDNGVKGYIFKIYEAK